MNKEEIKKHKIAAEKLNLIKDQAFYFIGKNISKISEYEVNQFILKIFGFKRFSILGRGYISDNSQPNSTSIQNKLRYLKDNRINYYLYRLLPYNSGLIKVDQRHPDHNMFHLSNFIMIRKDIKFK